LNRTHPRLLRNLCACATLVAIVTLSFSTARAGPLEGRWVLVEETYGSGGLNLVREKPPQTIRFVREGVALAGRTRLAPDEPERSWPVFFLEQAEAAAAALEELSFSPSEDHVVARYRTPFVREDKVRLDIVEDYRVSEDGESMVGTVKVTFLHAGETRGGFVLHRRFERQP
jgi:hypothetical protein